MLGHVYDVLGAAGIGIELVAFVLLLLGPTRRFLALLTFIVFELASTLGLTLADLVYKGSAQITAAKATEGQKFYAHLYWTDEVLLNLLQFLLVIVLTYTATEEGRKRAAVGRLLGGVAVVVMLLPFVLFHPTFTPWPKAEWFNSTTQLLNFGGTIMNLALWTALIGSRRRDPQLLTVSAGLGVIVTGAAISYGLRHFIPPGGLWAPNLLLMLTHIGGLTAWCWAFRPTAAPRPAPSSAFTSL